MGATASFREGEDSDCLVATANRAGKQLPIGATPPVEYANLRIGAYQQVVSGVGASNGLAVLCDANDVRTMVVHALIRTLFRKQR